MKHAILLLATAALLTNCKRDQKIDPEDVAQKFKEHADHIQTVEYTIHRIDTFPQGGVVWNNRGVALIQKDEADEIYGFSFFGRRNDVPNDYVYDHGIAFEISPSEKTYKTYQCNAGFIGSPGGQMILPNIFFLDSVYKSRTITESDSTFIMKYEFENDTVDDVRDHIKIIELAKDNYFPVKVTRASNVHGARSVSEVKLSNVKINKEVKNSISSMKSGFGDFQLVPLEQRLPNPLLQAKLPPISLPNLLDQSTIVDLTIDKLTLVDFWESWCGPCVASIPKIESLSKRYPSQLKVVGITTGDDEAAIQLINNKGATFLNLVGNKQTIQEFGIDSWPTYFLIDKNGIVQKEYFGFSEKMESDIEGLIDHADIEY